MTAGGVMVFDTVPEQALYFRAALLLGLLPGRVVVAWADAAIASAAEPPADLVELATTDPADITGLRYALFKLGGERESPPVVHAVLRLVARDLGLGRRGLSDTVTVLRQLRTSLKLEPSLVDELRALSVEFSYRDQRGEENVDRRIREWLSQYE